MAQRSTPISPRLDSAAIPSSRRWRDLGLLFGLILLVLAGLAGLAAATGWEETLQAFKSLTLIEISLLLALSLINYFFRGIRWHLFSDRLGLATTMLQDLRHFFGGFAMTVTPGRVGELVRMRWIGRETGWSFEKTAPLILVDRAADLAAMAILLAIGLALSASGVSGGIPVALIALIGAVVATRPTLLRAAAGIGHILTGRRFPRIFAKVRRAALSLNAFTGPTLLLAAGALGLVGWMAEGYAFYLLLTWMGADIGIWMALTIFIFSTIAGGLTGAPGGLGGAEAAMVALLLLEGTPPEIAVPATLIIRVTTLWFAIGIGLLVFPIAEKMSVKAENELETD